MVASPPSPLCQPLGIPALKKTSKSLDELPDKIVSISKEISVELTEVVVYWTPPIKMSTESVVSESMPDPVIVITYFKSEVNSTA